VKNKKIPYVSSRVLKQNVGFLLSEGSANHRDIDFNIPTPIQVSDDLLIEYITGKLRFSRIKEGILVQGTINIGYENECIRCLEMFVQEIPVEIEEMYAYLQPKDTEFIIYADGILDLAPLIRSEVLIAASHKALCREDCKGLCLTCGINLNHETCDCDNEQIDPRFAQLRALLHSDA
jgi:uncharacterized protein